MLRLNTIQTHPGVVDDIDNDDELAVQWVLGQVNEAHAPDLDKAGERHSRKACEKHMNKKK